MAKGMAVLWAAGIIGLAVSPAWTMPVELRDADVKLEIPEGFEESAPQTNDESGIVRLFVRRDSGDEEPDALLTIRQVKTNEPQDVFLRSSNSASLGESLRRYSERLNQMDIEVLAARATNEWGVMAESSARLMLGSNTIQIDLKSKEMRDGEMAAMMRHILAGAIPAEPPPAKEGFKGWGAAVLCAVLALAILVVVMGRGRV